MIADLKKHVILLSVLCILLCIKFIFFPIIEWQDNQLFEINNLRKQQHKVDNVILNHAKTNKLNLVLDENIKIINDVYFSPELESTFKITQQKWLEKVLRDNHLKIMNLGWQAKVVNDEGNIVIHHLQVSLSGQSVDVIKFIGVIESNKQLIFINDFNMTIKNQNEKSLGKMTGRLNLKFFMRNNLTGTSDSIL